MIRHELKAILKDILPDEEIVIDYVPKGKEGDYFTNAAFKIASKNNKNPQDVAEQIAARIHHPMLRAITVHYPGYINFTIDEKYLQEKVFTKETIDIGKGTSVLVEYVSANPTGPLNVVSARAAAVGDSLVSIMNATGFVAKAEFYVNDTGRQIELLGESVNQRMNQLRGGEAKIPDEGYHGEYLLDVAREALKQGLETQEDIEAFAVDYFVKHHRTTLERFGVSFHAWIHESEIFRKGLVDKVLQSLRDKGLAFEEDGAVFFRSTAFGDTRDRVIITRDKRSTYLLPDMAYHVDKIQRNFKVLINIWGPDHHGHIAGLQGGIIALGYPRDILKILIVQEVKIKKGDKLVTMSKRAGTIATLDELLEHIPKDVVRFFFLMRSSSQHLDFDIDLALTESEENPVYYVQYAYARIKSIVKFAQAEGIADTTTYDASFIKEKEELALVKHILKFNEILEDAVRLLEPYVLTYYLIDTARAFHYFYQKHRVVSDNHELTRARLALIRRTAETLERGLSILGISCPETM